MGAGPRPFAVHGLYVHWLRTVQLPRLRGAEVLYVGPAGAGSCWAPRCGHCGLSHLPLFLPAPRLWACVSLPLASSPFTLHTDLVVVSTTHLQGPPCPPRTWLSTSSPHPPWHLSCPISGGVPLSHQGCGPGPAWPPTPASSTVPSSCNLHLPQDRSWGLLLMQWV